MDIYMQIYTQENTMEKWRQQWGQGMAKIASKPLEAKEEAWNGTDYP